LNIILNARDAMKSGGTVTIFTKDAGNCIETVVSDTGEGIAPEHLSKIFDPFFTTKPVGKGTGLGLSICYGIIESHQGKIMVKSEVGKGTTFTILLPKADASGSTIVAS